MPTPLTWDSPGLSFDSPGLTWDGEAANPNPDPTMLQNALSITITAAQEAAIITKADELLALIEVFAVSLTDEQRASIFKLGDARLAFDEKCDTYLHQNTGLVPPGPAWRSMTRTVPPWPR